jgi:hypothetical protein
MLAMKIVRSCLPRAALRSVGGRPTIFRARGLIAAARIIVPLRRAIVRSYCTIASISGRITTLSRAVARSCTSSQEAAAVAASLPAKVRTETLINNTYSTQGLPELLQRHNNAIGTFLPSQNVCFYGSLAQKRTSLWTSFKVTRSHPAVLTR